MQRKATDWGVWLLWVILLGGSLAALALTVILSILLR